MKHVEFSHRAFTVFVLTEFGVLARQIATRRDAMDGCFDLLKLISQAELSMFTRPRL